MNTPPDYVIEAARQIAADGPCAKSKRGVVLFNGEDADHYAEHGAKDRARAEHGIMVSRAFNGPPTGFTCTGSLACKSACARVCVHAEQRAIIRALGADDAVDLELVHVKVVDGAVVPGKAPCCVECSRLVVEVGLRGVWLFEAQRWHTEVRCKACWKVTIIPQGGGTTGVCEQCDLVYRLLDLPGEDVFDITSGEWRFYSAVDFHRTTMRNLGISSYATGGGMTLPPGYDQWKLAEPTEAQFDRGCDDEGRDDSSGPEDLDDDRDRCVLGDACCCPHPFHGADECFDAEMAEALMGNGQPDFAALRHALTRLLWDSVADEAACSCSENDRCPQCEAMAALGLEAWRGPRDAEQRLPRFT